VRFASMARNKDKSHGTRDVYALADQPSGHLNRENEREKHESLIAARSTDKKEE
jgi:hypothetical protein